ncbi:MAG: hypothetical protein LH614_20340 [Pyrinomonadaceae bacterium]|nr:hypothetical protein [Pyrinomonadaceae bacterium]
MRSKNILSIAAFVAAFALSAAFASLFITKTRAVTTEFVPTYGYKSTSCFKYKNIAAADKIAALISEDKRNGRESDRAVYLYGEDIFSSSDSSAISGYAGAVEKYVDDSSTMNAGNLPEDFQNNWREHMKAWRDYSDFLNRMKKSSNRMALSLEELEEIDAFHSREISRTWQAVLQNGRSYGAEVH